MSWALRVAAVNLVSVSWLRSRLVISQPRPFNAEDSLKLAAVMVADPSELRARLPVYGRADGTPAILYFGQMTLFAPCVRFRRPQVCPACLRCHAHCPAAWDYSCYAVCPIHCLPMVDQCVSCRRSLTWDRLSVDVCRCGAYIKSPVDEPSDGYRVAGFFSRLISAHIAGETHGCELTALLPAWWSLATLDGLMRLTVAMGIVDKEDCAVRFPSLHRFSSRTWALIVARGLERLMQVDSSEPAQMTSLRRTVWEGGLESLALKSVSPVDGQIAELLLHRIFARKLSVRFGASRGSLSQISLF
ncbi:hypothetical protein J2W37_005269 [Variovorax paradoxus]|nr:hypothetical protein [Variovorax paradoxus]